MGDYSTNQPQRGDVWHFMGENGGDIEEKDGFITMTTFIETLINYCLFGGNEDDDGSAATSNQQWWGNEDEPDERKLRGKLQSMLDGRPLTSALLPTFQDAAKEDIKIGAKGYVETVFVSASISAPNRLDLFISVTDAQGTPYEVNLRGITV